MLQKALLAVIMLSIYSCQAQIPEDLIGDYMSTDCNFYQKYIDGFSLKGGWILHLDKDATFSYTTCSEACLANGK